MYLNWIYISLTPHISSIYWNFLHSESVKKKIIYQFMLISYGNTRQLQHLYSCHTTLQKYLANTLNIIITFRQESGIFQAPE